MSPYSDSWKAECRGLPDMSRLSIATSMPDDNKEFLWTPGKMTETSYCGSSEEDSSDAIQINPIEQQMNELDTLNEALDRLPGGTFSPLTFQLNCSWSAASVEDKDMCLEKAEEACKIICNIISPKDGQSLFQSLLDSSSEPSVSQDLDALMTAYANAPTRILKLQILSIYI